MSTANLQLPQARRFAQTSRVGSWWAQPLVVFLGLSAFVVYSTWAAAQADHYFVPATASTYHGQNYLSPMYSPVLWDIPGKPSGHAWFGEAPAWLVRFFESMPFFFFVFSPAFLILVFPAGFRFTCYYYRGAYYKAFWQDPPACAVGEPGWRGKRYRGEHRWPLLVMNIHRYFLYFALAFIGILSYDAVVSYWFRDPATGEGGLGVAVGSLVLTINPILLGGYTLGCHSLRHLVGGKKDCIGSGGARRTAYDCVSCLNRRHMAWAWVSLIWVGFTDFYVRMVAMGVWTDLRIL